MKNIMIDLETMGENANAAIMAIGAVYFDEDGTGETFYRVVDLESSVNCGLVMDPSTVMWWMKQDDEARSAFERDGVSIVAALKDLGEFVSEHGAVWGNGADFDNAILQTAYKNTCIPLPWKFWNNRCYRTMKSMHRDVKMNRSGTHHNALDDAISQAKHLIDIVNEKEIDL